MELSEEEKKLKKRVEQVRELAAKVPEILDGMPVPSTVFACFAGMVEALLREEEP